MKSCEYYKLLSDKIEKFLKDYCKEKVINESIIIEINNLFSYIDCFEEPCMSCADCFDYYFYNRLYLRYKNGINIDELEKQLQAWNKIRNYDKCFDLLSVGKGGIKFDNNQIFINTENKKTIYIDHNILIDYANDRDFREKINLSKNNFQYCFSSSHLNEIIKIKDLERKAMLTKAIISLTDSIGVYELDNELKIVKIDIDYVKDIEDEQNTAIEISEEYRKIQINDKKIFFKEYNTIKFSKFINSTGVFVLDDLELNKLLLHVACSYNIEKIKNTKFRNTSEINHLVYSLFNIFNILGYKIDKKEKTIISSAHDIEHIKFASICDIFVSDDSKLLARSIEIYKFIKSKTILIDKKQFIDLICEK
ncbi:hypothetical protein [Clostridium estertheticum]|uniref:hypothetical protein n=1 Tax=Clostridium estertheticum TaxID=238834 RepID=UPI001C6E3810|nr:hypothetical protein [Clostridium estertheticum]MBW9150988.1 hypothetical protein [Clostridium estertheticum]WLC84301.1 hypothetical protein KTC97_00320 [Clostridium estertheticum]